MKQQAKGGPGSTAKKIASIKAVGSGKANAVRKTTQAVKSVTKVSKAVKRAQAPKPSKKIGGR